MNDDKKWLYIVGGGLLLTIILMNSGSNKKDSSKKQVGSDGNTQPPVTQPPVTQPPVTQPPVTQPPANSYPIMPANKASMLQRNLNFFLRPSTDPDKDSGGHLNAGQIPVTGRIDERTVNAFTFLLPYWLSASNDWRDNFYLLDFFNRGETFDYFNIPPSEQLKFAIEGSNGQFLISKSLYAQLTTVDLVRNGVRNDWYSGFDAAAFGNATE